MLVLKTNGQQAVEVRVDPRYSGLAPGEAGLRAPLDIGDLAAEDPVATKPVEDRLERIGVHGPRLAQDAAELFGEAERPGNHGLLDFAAGERVERDHGRAAHVDGDRAGEALGPAVVDRFEQGGVALLVRQGHGGGRDAVHGRSDHLNLGKSAAHPVRVDEGDAKARGDLERRRRVEAARLDRNGVGYLAAEVFLEDLEGADDLVPAGKLLDHHGRGSHHRRRDD
jgi:hypothetical protein